MLDFLMISTKSTQKGVLEIYPKFIIGTTTDIMIRGGDFYAIWVEERGLWSTNENDALQLIDKELTKYAEENKDKFDARVKILYMWDAETGMIDSFHKYCQKQMRDRFHMLDEELIFANSLINKKDYSSKRLSYALEPGPIDNYNKLMSTLYSDEERHKIEWAIGSIVSGDSKKLQKFMVLYGAAGTGKSTVLNIIQALFKGYYAVFDAKALGSSNNQFALEAFKSSPLIAIQHDGDLSKIEDNTRLNSLVSHELMSVNEKYKTSYANDFKCFLFMGTNKPVKITDGKSGLIRRLIDVSPSGNKLDAREYRHLVKQIDFELGAIACHCKTIYLDDTAYYDDYIPIAMLGASNDFYNFMADEYFIFKKNDGVSLKQAWEMYKVYCDEAKVAYPFSQRTFKEELKSYFWEYKERYRLEDDTRARNYYSGFRADKFEQNKKTKEIIKDDHTLILNETKSIFDSEFADSPAQYATTGDNPRPKVAWSEVITKLHDLDTSMIHYVKVPENHIVIDFDITDSTGCKSYEKNLQAASLFPPTYAELSKGGSGIHLHYLYSGDVSMLERIYSEHIEIKVFSGGSSLRRKLTRCNNLPISVINSGLPLKGEQKLISKETIKSESSLRSMIARNLNKEFHPYTKSSIDFISTILDDAYKSGMIYDVSDMYNSILSFGMHSSNQAELCVKIIGKMKFKSDETEASNDGTDERLVFFDTEVFPNLFVVNWKFQGINEKIIRMINPSPSQIEQLLRFRLVGYNCRGYDNHMLYARLNGYTNEQLFVLSQRIIVKKEKSCLFGNAYNLSYTDVYDFASAANKKSLKKFEIELGIHHQELGLDWTKPVPEELWIKVAEYCDNDVLALEAVFEHLKGDWLARQILADITNLSVNNTTNTLSARMVFGTNKNPQNQFKYRNLAEPCAGKPHFPGYTYKNGISTYRGKVVGEGGYVFAVPGMYGNVALLDVESMHPTSAIEEELFGALYTMRYNELKLARLAIKKGDFEKARTMLGGVLTKYLDDPSMADALSNALKTAINSVYGLTAAKFDNAFKDKRNIDNIVAKRGALFMVDLEYAVQKEGYIVAHIKTDSIKIPDADPYIIGFVNDFGKKYGYTFEHEATYDRMCLVNDAVYIAKYASIETCNKLYGYVPKDNKKKGLQWTATGTQFAVPYVFKTLFSKEEITFRDMCETKSVSTAMYLDMNENLPDISIFDTVKKVRTSTDKITKKDANLAYEWSTLSDEELDRKLSAGHDYHFVGKVGSFCPMKIGTGGGKLLRLGADRSGNPAYYSATGSIGYTWLEAEAVETLNKEADIDRSYYVEKVTEAVEVISNYGDFEWFVSEDSYEAPPIRGGCGRVFSPDNTDDYALKNAA